MMGRRTSRGPLPAAAAALLLAPVLALALSLASAAPAYATSYRYWSFWQRDGDGWTYAQQGPAINRPSDGDVEGWRFGVGEESGSKAVLPRTDADFAAVCADTPAKDGTKRIALVIDFGKPGDAPPGERPPAAEPRTECARVPKDATSADALAAVAKPLRFGPSGLLCAIEGYPRSGCGEPVSSGPQSGTDSKQPDSGAQPASGQAAEQDGEGGPALGLLAGAAAVAVIGGAAVWQARRRRRT